MSGRVLIDPGHGPSCVNGGKAGYKEHAGMWKVSNELKAALEQRGFFVALTRTEQADPSLTARGKQAAGFDLFISEHSNAHNGSARGVEVYYSVKIPADKPFAAALSKRVATLMGNPDRGAKVNESQKYPGQDYFTVMLSAQRAGAKHILLIESGFHDNVHDEAFLLSDANLKAIAEAQAAVIGEFLAGHDASDTPTLRRSHKGAAVLRMQRLLNASGARLAEDGSFGPATEVAVLAFQKAHGLVADGICCLSTWAALQAYQAPKAAAYPLAEANITAMHDAGVINSPGYWRGVTQVQYLDALLANAAREGVLDKRIDNGINDAGIAIATLVDAGVINSPDYWSGLIAADVEPYLSALLVNMANKCRIILEKIVHAEAAGEDEKGQVLVANVILNRVRNTGFPDGIYGVVFQHSGGVYQFSPIGDGAYAKAQPSASVKVAVSKALDRVDYSQGALFFRTISGATPDCWHERALIRLFDYGGHRFYL